mmetsp:Transcript_35166/g.98740  ORF Transcript_35166/g.98740 Transcript_35166/m.98740 type:complete len:763 (-) Transcript_35166:29-2317(-)
MGSGASSPAKRRLPWPPGARAFLYPGGKLPDGLKTDAPLPCMEDGISFWRLGGPEKARLRIVEDEGKLFQLGDQYTVAVCCRAAVGSVSGYDSLLLGHDNKHWAAMKGGEGGTVCCVDGNSGKAVELEGKVEPNKWNQLFLRPLPGGGTSVLSVDDEGLLELGTTSMSLVGSKLRNAGWASNHVDVCAVAVWNRTVPWSELAAAVAPPRPSPKPSSDPAPKVTQFRGQILDLKRKPVGNVMVSWHNGGCMSDKDGCFAGEVEDDDDDNETTVPEDGGSETSGSSDASWVPLSFTCEGFAPMSSPARCNTDTSMQVTMSPISASVQFDAAAGGSIVDEASGSSVTMPPACLAYPDGSEVTGPVTVSLAVIDVTTPEGLAAMPGDFSAIGEGGCEVMLQSLGAAWVGAVDEGGRQLQVRDGSSYTLDLQTEAKANASKMDAVPEMWSFDETSGKWLLEPSEMKINGEAAPNKARPSGSSAAAVSAAQGPKIKGGKKKGMKGKMKGYAYDPSGGVVTGCMSPEAFQTQVAASGRKSLAAEVTKMGYINCDLAYHHPQRAVMLQGLVLDSKREPMASVQLWATGRDYQGKCPDATGPDGRFGAMIAQFDSEVDVEVQFRRESSREDAIEVCYKQDEKPSRKDKSLNHKLLEEVPGQYKKTSETQGGRPVWAREGRGSKLSEGRIAWNEPRRRWESLVDGQVAFTFSPGDEPGPPFSGGWVPTPAVGEVFAPKYSRPLDILSQSFGPFKTGDPGQFVDVGEIVVTAA